MPITAIRTYFGAQIGLYNAFLSHYASWSIALAAIAFPAGLEMLFFKHIKVSVSAYEHVCVCSYV